MDNGNCQVCGDWYAELENITLIIDKETPAENRIESRVCKTCLEELMDTIGKIKENKK